ncbi:hypothetical protein JTE90_011760 [Oedothorax gibbosus]|uniref:Uncharacterized protein n=1 Tax=Oedothorax gibbosus TaxID=931172 RepID=A0AAV6VU52_9ARAC|nr:hypothetical protein JTE90_011760 [Oedothorax gibbosus]
MASALELLEQEYRVSWNMQFEALVFLLQKISRLMNRRTFESNEMRREYGVGGAVRSSSVCDQRSLSESKLSHRIPKLHDTYEDKTISRKRRQVSIGDCSFGVGDRCSSPEKRGQPLLLCIESSSKDNVPAIQRRQGWLSSSRLQSQPEIAQGPYLQFSWRAEIIDTGEPNTCPEAILSFFLSRGKLILEIKKGKKIYERHQEANPDGHR